MHHCARDLHPDKTTRVLWKTMHKFKHCKSFLKNKTCIIFKLCISTFLFHVSPPTPTSHKITTKNLFSTLSSYNIKLSIKGTILCTYVTVGGWGVSTYYLPGCVWYSRCVWGKCLLLQDAQSLLATHQRASVLTLQVAAVLTPQSNISAIGARWPSGVGSWVCTHMHIN